MDRKELKIQALRERVANLTAEYEDRVADLRVELTVVSNERDGLQAEVAGLREQVVQGEDSDEYRGADAD